MKIGGQICEMFLAGKFDRLELRLKYMKLLDNAIARRGLVITTRMPTCGFVRCVKDKNQPEYL